MIKLASRWAIVALALAVLAVPSGCSAPPASHTIGLAPDAVILTRAPQGGDLSMQVVRPTVWMTPSGDRIVDERMTIALADTQRATWRAAARLDLLEAIAFARALRTATAEQVESDSMPVTARVEHVPEQSAAELPVEDARWQVLPSECGVVDLGIVDAAGRCLVHVRLDQYRARSLARQVELLARTAN
ncbi:MAG: hypothetical protein MK101_02765 [Phycisphaerales bacterium]|nr:hypothetical protein [Phycisphaerales bacterium]